MQVIAGKYKGRRLKFPKTKKLRPITQKVKGALFNIIGQGISGSVFLDLFSGTGQVGIEAVSRGAKLVYFVDLNIRYIKINLRLCRVTDGVVVVREDAINFILKSATKKFDYIFIGPPYEDKDLYLNSLKRIDEFDILSTNGIAIAEHEKKLMLPEKFGDVVKTRTVGYGGTVLSFYKIKKLRDVKKG